MMLKIVVAIVNPPLTLSSPEPCELVCDDIGANPTLKPFFWASSRDRTCMTNSYNQLLRENS
jgi:hypothetical protein